MPPPDFHAERWHNAKRKPPRMPKGVTLEKIDLNGIYADFAEERLSVH